jgi:hypothetical protein
VGVWGGNFSDGDGDGGMRIQGIGGSGIILLCFDIVVCKVLNCLNHHKSPSPHDHMHLCNHHLTAHQL